MFTAQISTASDHSLPITNHLVSALFSQFPIRRIEVRFPGRILAMEADQMLVFADLQSHVNRRPEMGFSVYDLDAGQLSLIVSESLLRSDEQLAGADVPGVDKLGVDQLSGGRVVFANPSGFRHEEVGARDREPTGRVG